MTATTFYRIAAVVFVLFAAGHTMKSSASSPRQPKARPCSTG